MRCDGGSRAVGERATETLSTWAGLYAEGRSARARREVFGHGFAVEE